MELSVLKGDLVIIIIVTFIIVTFVIVVSVRSCGYWGLCLFKGNFVVIFI
jgi:hypothetical protein